MKLAGIVHENYLNDIKLTAIQKQQMNQKKK